MREVATNGKATVFVEGNHLTYMTAEGFPLNVDFRIPDGSQELQDSAILDFLEAWVDDEDLIDETLENWRGDGISLVK